MPPAIRDVNICKCFSVILKFDSIKLKCRNHIEIKIREINEKLICLYLKFGTDCFKVGTS